MGRKEVTFEENNGRRSAEGRGYSYVYMRLLYIARGLRWVRSLPLLERLSRFSAGRVRWLLIRDMPRLWNNA